MQGRHDFFRKNGFTLVEILVVLTLMAVIALPFTNMFIFGVKGSYDNTEHVLGYNLAREKLEELKGLPYEMVKSDYENFREVFQDRLGFDEAYSNEDSFIENFTDVFTELSLKDSEQKTSLNRLEKLYQKAYLKDIIIYPEDYTGYRRVLKIEKISDSAMPAKLKKATVLVHDRDGKRRAELTTLIGMHK